MRGALVLAACCGAAACSNGAEVPEDVQRIDFASISEPQHIVLDSPDTEGASWTVNESGQAISFGPAGQPPMLTLECRLQENPPQLRIIRHVRARPGKGAVLPIIGNGMRSRFLVDATLTDGEWRWEGTVAAADPRLDVLTGPRQLLVTLPGGGTLDIDGSRIPGEFVTWCRAGGRVMQAEAAEQAEATEEAEETSGPSL